MILGKKKYKKAEVEQIIKEIVSDYEGKLAEQKELIISLKNENCTAMCSIEKYKNKEAQISSALKNAEEKAQDLISFAQKSYDLELANIRNFSTRWKNYFNYIKEKYPHNNEIKEANKVCQKIDKIVSKDCQSKDKIIQIDCIVKTSERQRKKEAFNPKQKINDYISSTGSNGFNLDEVLNPGELDLGDICKELGLTENE